MHYFKHVVEVRCLISTYEINWLKDINPPYMCSHSNFILITSAYEKNSIKRNESNLYTTKNF
jgi:hypothetical protein